MLKNHYGITVDSEKPITGVFQKNHISYLGDELFNSISLNYEEHLNEIVDEKVGEIQRLLDELDGETMEASVRDIKDICEALEYPEDQLEDIETNDWLIGFVKIFIKEEGWYWFDALKYGYKPDENAEYSAIVGEIYTQVVESKWLIKCALCSPCYPGQGDANSNGEFLTYSFPPDMFEDKDPIAKRIFPANEILYIIHSIDECGRDVWWSKEDGWVEEGYTIFTESEKSMFCEVPRSFSHGTWQTFRRGFHEII